ncbi:MAG: ABC transporter permease [Alphaproteobacteria bacterium]|nr:ABC transporter permease [Alphaproteobacteria bacterium]
MTLSSGLVPDPGPKAKATLAGSGPLASLVRELLLSRSAVIGGTVLMLVILACFVAPHLWGLAPNDTDLMTRFLPPVWSEGGRWSHPLGTDNLGRDVLARILAGGQVSLLVAVCTVLVAVSVGMVLGTLAGYYGGRVDSLIMRVGDLFLAYPFMLLTISVIAILGPSLPILILVLALADWVTYARTVRGSVLSVKQREYVVAAHSIGTRDGDILRHHVLPNVLSPVLVLGTVRAANYIVWESGLSFLGMGVPPPTPTWGMMLSEGRDFILDAWWLATLPGIAIMLTILSLNLLGDGLRDALDPRLKGNRR